MMAWSLFPPRNALWCAAALAAPLPCLLTPPASTAQEKSGQPRKPDTKELDKLVEQKLADMRRTACVNGGAAKRVADEQAAGEKFTGPSDLCVSVLEDAGRHGRLFDFYRQALKEWKGDATHAAAWPHTIGTAVLADKSDVEIGNYQQVEVKPALAFDAGFTVAYEEGKQAKSGSVKTATAKELAESCLNQQLTPRKCFTAGYLYGAHAVGRMTFEQ